MLPALGQPGADDDRCRQNRDGGDPDRQRARAPVCFGSRRLLLQPPQVHRELLRRLIAQGPVLLQGLVEDSLEPLRQARSQSHRGFRSPVQDLIEDRSRGSAGERRRSCRHLVEHDAEREQVRPPVQLLAQHLLGRHIGHRTRRRPGGGQRRFGHGSLGLRACRLRPTLIPGELREAEVQHLGVSATRDEEIRRLDVPVHDPCAVCRLQSIRHLDAQPRDLVHL